MYKSFEEKSFVGWMRETGQMFTGEEYQTRFGIWLSNQRLVREHNAANGATFSLAMNKLAHLTPSEYKALLGFKMNMAPRGASRANSRLRNVDAIDWRDKGVVNTVKDQASCGSCWAFSTIQAQESGYAIKTGKLQRLSEQNLVDCVTTCNGCNGGLMDAAYNYVIKYQDGKFMLEDDYPYTAKDGSCKFDAKKAVQKVNGVIYVEEGSESDLANKIATYGPACIAIDASHYSFQLYGGGIYDEPSCSSYSLDHGVGCVGFGKEGNTAYWIVRNSWGTTWGEKGYVRMIKDKNNQCGEASMACIPSI